MHATCDLATNKVQSPLLATITHNQRKLQDEMKLTSNKTTTSYVMVDLLNVNFLGKHEKMW